MYYASELVRGKPPEVWTVGPNATIYKALEIMSEKNVGALPVVENGRLLGMFSERDYARKVVLKGKSSHVTAVREAMSSQVISVAPDATLETCMELMTNHRVRHLPVVDEGRLVGILSIGDILKAKIADQEVMISDLTNFINGGRS